MDPEPDLIQELTADHGRIQRLFDRLRASEPLGARRAELVARAVRAIALHLDIESRCLAPVVRQEPADGDRPADGGRPADRADRADQADAGRAGRAEYGDYAEHAALARTLRALEAREPGGEEYGELLLSLVTRVTDHARHQEQRLFPRLQAVCPPDVLARYGREVRKLRAAHAAAPGPAAVRRGPAGRLRDRLRSAGPTPRASATGPLVPDEPDRAARPRRRPR
ncbi:hemerythrin domain-containing protein [Streptomyces sp. NPDC047928]|uniref:hemerythrin domain-containing protein n=1 Tax=unclassified Streptomyces TaxID=2593676 RepID=UPI00371D7126